MVGDAKLDAFYSIQGLDRFQAKVTRDFNLHDRRFVRSISLGYRYPNEQKGAPLARERGPVPWLRVERATRTGVIGTLTTSATETRYQAGLSLVF